MDAIVVLFGHLAALGLVVAGALWTVGLTAARDRALRFAVRMVAIAILLPLAFAFACDKVRDIAAAVPSFDGVTPTVPSNLFLVVLLGHVVLAVVLIRRRLLGTEAVRRRAAEFERARMRERPRLPPDLEEPEE